MQKFTTFDNLAWKGFSIYERFIFAKDSIFIFEWFWFGFVEDLRGGILIKKVFFKKRMNSDVIKVDSLFGIRVKYSFEKILDFGGAILDDFFPRLLNSSFVAEISGKFNEFFAFLFGFWGTVKFERKLHIEHEVEQNAKSPHIDFEAVLILVVDFRRHVGTGSQNSEADVLDVFGETKIGQFVHFFPVFSFHQDVLGLDVTVDESSVV